MAAIANDIEFTFLNGTFQDGNYDDVAYKTRGIITAIESNITAAEGASLGYWLVAELIKSISDGFAPTDSLVLMCNSVHIMQLNVDASANGLTVIPAAREINGIKIDELITPFGNVGIAATLVFQLVQFSYSILLSVLLFICLFPERATSSSNPLLKQVRLISTRFMNRLVLTMVQSGITAKSPVFLLTLLLPNTARKYM